MTMPTLFPLRPPHDGPDLTLEDHLRLGQQLAAVLYVMRDGKWRTLAEIEQVTRYPQASISSRLRDLRKIRFGAWTVDRRRVSKGLWTYRVMP